MTDSTTGTGQNGEVTKMADETTLQDLENKIERLESELNSLKSTLENDYGMDLNIHRED